MLDEIEKFAQTLSVWVKDIKVICTVTSSTAHVKQ